MKIDWYRILPWFWIQNEPTDWAWDDALNLLLDSEKVVYISQHRAKIGDAVVWTSNFPYAYGHLYEPVDLGMLPSVRTRIRLRRAVRDAAIDEIFKAKWKGHMKVVK